MANSRTSFTLKVSCQSCHFNLLISDCDVGLTITTLDKKTAKDFEPYSSSPEQQLNVLDKLHKAGIKTYAFIGPILPEITNLEAIFKAIKGKADLVMAESLNTRCGNWGEILEVIKEYGVPVKWFYQH